ncbi:hypothetical protein HDR58_03860 [bacterium]|nr:hypothetical protein [bacterium]
MDKHETNNFLTLGIILLIAGIFLMSYSISTYNEVRNLSEKIDLEELETNTHMSTSDKYFKYLSYADYLNQRLKKNQDLLFKNSTCVYLDYAQKNSIALYRLTYNGLQTDESRKNVAAGNIRALYSLMDAYRTCKQTAGYKSELENIIVDIQKMDEKNAQKEYRMESFMQDYGANIPPDEDEQTYPELPQQDSLYPESSPVETNNYNM